MRALNLVTSIGASGYGTVGFNLLRSLTRAGVEVALFPVDAGAYATASDLQLGLDAVALMRRAVARQANYVIEAPCLRIFAEFSMTLFAGKGSRAGMSFYETDELSPRELHHLGSLDHLLAPSAWAKEVADSSGLSGPRISVVPMGVDRTVFHEAEDSTGTADTVFLHIGKWEHRKAQDFVLEAFATAFTPKDEVRLDLMCHNPLLGDRNDEWMAICRRSPMAGRIRILDRVATSRDVADRMRAADCGIFPARAEGWNLELLEMMSCGKPVIATNYSAHTAFADSENCRLIEIDSLEPAVDERYHQIYGNQKIGRWAHLGSSQLEQAVEHLRAIHRARQESGTLTNPAGIRTAQRLSWESSAATVAEVLSI